MPWHVWSTARPATVLNGLLLVWAKCDAKLMWVGQQMVCSRERPFVRDSATGRLVEPEGRYTLRRLVHDASMPA